VGLKYSIRGPKHGCRISKQRTIARKGAQWAQTTYAFQILLVLIMQVHDKANSVMFEMTPKQIIGLIPSANSIIIAGLQTEA